jgi:HEAT repeat protein
MKSTTRWFTLVVLAALAMPDEAASQQSRREATAFASAAATASVSYRAESQQGDADMREARRAMDDGNFRDAARMFERIAERYPRTTIAADALYNQAFALYRIGNSSSLSNALEALRDLDRLYPSSTANKGDAGSLRIRICDEMARRGDEACARDIVSTAQGQQNTRSSASTSPSSQSGQNQSCPRDGDDNDERMMALNALMNMNSEAAIPILERTLNRRDACSRALRKKAVFLIAQKRGDNVVETLLRVAREDPEASVREDAVFWLSNVRDPRVVDILAEMAMNANDRSLQDKAIFSLSNTRSEKASQVLRDIAQNDRATKNAREQAIFWLGNRRDADAIEFLKGLYSRLNDRDLKEKVLFAVSNQRGAGSGAWLIGIATNERESIELRKQALFWAGNNRAASVAEISALYDRVGDREMKEQIIFVLSQNRAEASVDKLMDIARRDSDRELRSKAVFWLGQSRDPRVLKFLEDLINR